MFGGARGINSYVFVRVSTLFEHVAPVVGQVLPVSCLAGVVVRLVGSCELPGGP